VRRSARAICAVVRTSGGKGLSGMGAMVTDGGGPRNAGAHIFGAAFRPASQ
jgi:hypothetical protein